MYHVKHNRYMNKHDIVNSRMWSIDFNRTKVNIAIYRCIYNTVIQLHTYTIAECNDLDSASRRGRRWIICNLDVFLFGILMKNNRFLTIRALVSTPKRFQIVLGKWNQTKAFMIYYLKEKPFSIYSKRFLLKILESYTRASG